MKTKRAWPHPAAGVMDENMCARPSGHCLVQNDHRKAECTHRHHCNLRYHFSNVVRSGIGKNVFEHALELFHVLKTILLFLVLKSRVENNTNGYYVWSPLNLINSCNHEKSPSCWKAGPNYIDLIRTQGIHAKGNLGERAFHFRLFSLKKV